MNKISYTDLNPAEFKKMSENENVVVIDIRTPPEIAERYISGALTGYDVYEKDFESKFRDLNPEVTYLIYCRSGARSAAVCDRFSREGFENLYNLRGGILAWVAEGFETTA